MFILIYILIKFHVTTHTYMHACTHTLTTECWNWWKIQLRSVLELITLYQYESSSFHSMQWLYKILSLGKSRWRVQGKCFIFKSSWALNKFKIRRYKKVKGYLKFTQQISTKSLKLLQQLICKNFSSNLCVRIKKSDPVLP